MKEDLLEQLVDDYLKFNGFFGAHNVKFQPLSIYVEIQIGFSSCSR
jgi:hypothetical protein